MGWLFNDKPSIPVEVEVVAHKEANQEVVQQAKDANEQLKHLFEKNGFTVKIVLAMGAKQQHRGANHRGN